MIKRIKIKYIKHSHYAPCIAVAHTVSETDRWEPGFNQSYFDINLLKFPSHLVLFFICKELIDWSLSTSFIYDMKESTGIEIGRRSSDGRKLRKYEG